MDDLAKLIAKRLINRPDVHARQVRDGGYRPVHKPWTKSLIMDHLNGNATYGHYLLNTDNTVKFFALDIDLKTGGFWEDHRDLSSLPPGVMPPYDETVTRHECNPREAFRDWRHPGRDFFKRQMRYLADLFTEVIRLEFEIATFAEFTGNKGIHVYGLLDKLPAAEAREAAMITLERFGDCWQPEKGTNFWGCVNPEPGADFSNFSIEVFPKNTEIKEDGLGNLMRLPLGRNLKMPKAPCFFIDQRPEAKLLLAPHPDPASVLSNGDARK